MWVDLLFVGMSVWPGGGGFLCSGFLRLGLTLPCVSELQTKNVCVDLTRFMVLVFRFQAQTCVPLLAVLFVCFSQIPIMICGVNRS